MWRVFVLMLGGLFGPLSAAAVACDIPKPVPAETKPEKPAGSHVKKFITVELKGKPIAYRCFLYGRISVAVSVGGESYLLDLGEKKEWLKLISELGEKSAVVTGELEEVADPAQPAGKKALIVTVRELRTEGGHDEYVKKSFKIEVQGQLEDDPREDLHRPYNVSLVVKADGREYHLDFMGNKAFFGKAQNLMYQSVIVTGTLETIGRFNIIHVNTFEPATPPVIGCFVP